MVCRRMWFGAATILALVGTKPAVGGAITFATGNVETDMPSSNPNILTIVNHPLADGTADPTGYKDYVGQAAWMTDAGRINGWAIKDLRLSYDQADDRLYVGVNFYGVAGDAYGNALAGGPDPAHPWSASLPGHLGFGSSTDQTITVGIDLTNSGQPTFVAGIPSNHLDPRLIGPGTDGFTVNYYKNNGGGLGASYDPNGSLNTFNGNLAFEPSAAHPGFEFSIANVSQIPGFNLNNGIGVMAFAGTSADVDVGEDAVPYTHIALEQVPEPATVLAWSLVAAGAAVHGAVRRRRRGASQA